MNFTFGAGPVMRTIPGQHPSYVTTTTRPTVVSRPGVFRPKYGGRMSPRNLQSMGPKEYRTVVRGNNQVTTQRAMVKEPMTSRPARPRGATVNSPVRRTDEFAAKRILESSPKPVKEPMTSRLRKENPNVSNTFQGKYEVKNQLGDGTFATVKKCLERATGDAYAVKVIDKRRWARNPDVLRNLHREMKILKQCKSKNIVGIKENFETRDYIYIVTELIKGGDLLDCLVNGGPKKEDAARKLFSQLVNAVSYLHNQDIVHRDLKPENILIDNDGPNAQIKVCDFGQAVHLGDNENISSTAFGTYEYVAPEALKPGAIRPSKAMDIWSMGVILYILVCGIFPFDGQTDRQLFAKIMAGRYRFPTRFDSVLSREIKDLVSKCLTVDPSKRISIEKIACHPWLAGKMH